VIKTERDLHSS